MALHQLLCKPDAHMWALRHITSYLSKADGARLALTATESGRADLDRLLHWLLHGEWPPKSPRDAHLMLKVLPLPADSPLSLRKEVVQWAAQFGMVTVLGRVLDNEDSKTQEKLLGRIVRQAGFSSHVEVVEWLLGRCSLLGVSSVSVVKAVQRDALRHSHTASLILLHKRQLIRGTSVAMGLMVSEAAEVIANTLIDAVRQNCTEVVAFITAKYKPSELPLRDHDRLCICGFLLKQGHKRDAGVAASRQDETTQFAGRRIKRSRRNERGG